MSTQSTESLSRLELDPVTSRRLARFSERRNLLLMLRAVAVGVSVFVAAMLIVAVCDYLWVLGDGVRFLLSLVGYVVTFAAMWVAGIRGLGAKDPESLAKQLQSTAPQLRDDVLSAVELADPDQANGSQDFRQRLQDRVARRLAGLDVGNLLPLSLIRRWLTTGGIIAVVFLSLLLVPSMQFGRRFARAMLPVIPIQRASLTQIEILQPDPASGYVAQGDAVGIMVQITGRETDEVELHFRSDDGKVGSEMMTRRVALDSAATTIPSRSSATNTDADSSNSMLKTENHFAANLVVGESPMQYQVRAGDGITLWHTLTPLPRPRVNLFTKRYVFPKYAELADRVEEDEHGDLRGLVGTTANVTVQFDQSVEDAKVIFANQGGELAMTAVDETQTLYSVALPIKTQAQYQVDATSTRSGLNNPFGPSYTVSPIIDQPPLAQWDDSIDDMMIVSPLTVLDLAGTVIDDMPVDQMIQEFTVNSAPANTFAIAIDSPARESNPAWQWDLMARKGNNQSTPKLAGGDLVRTRLVAIDRRGQRGESQWIDVLIADDGFDAQRHRQVDQASELAKQTIAWASAAEATGRAIEKAGKEIDPENIQPLEQLYRELNDRTLLLVESVSGDMAISETTFDTNTLELLGRAVIALDGEIRFSVHDIQAALGVDRDDWKSRQKKLARDIANEGRRIAYQARRIDTLVRGVVSHELSLAVARDVSSLRESLLPILNKENGVPLDRFQRYVTVTMGRMNAIDELLARHELQLMDSTRQHFRGEHWSKWAERWSLLLQRIAKDNPSENAQRQLVSRLDGELKKKESTGMADGRLQQLFNESYRDIRREMRPYASLVQQIQRSGIDARRAKEKADKSSDAKESAIANLEADYWQATYENRMKQVSTLLAAQSNLHRARRRVDLQHAADLNLLRRAIENVNQNGFQPYRDESPEDVHNNLAGAIRVIESVHEAKLNQQELNQLLQLERSVDDSPDSRLSNSLWILRYSLATEWSVKQWQEAKLDWNELIEPIDKTRYDSDFSAAKDRISRRRWDPKEPVSAAAPLERLASRLNAGLAKLQANVIESRELIQRYVLSLPEQARKAADEADKAKESTNNRQDSARDTAEDLAEKQKDAEAAAEQTVQALIDLANTTDVLDDEEREIARDADAAASAIKDAADQAKQAAEDAAAAANDQKRDELLERAEERLQQLSETLNKTADHFEKVQQGEDVQQSREEMRQAEEALQIADELDERYEQTEQMANAAKSDPKELLKKLEKELTKNEPMQEELSDISENSIQTAKGMMEQAESDEKQLNQSLERSDAARTEAKRRSAAKIAELSRRIQSLSQRVLQPTEEASGWANEPQTRQKVSSARESIEKAKDAANQIDGENELTDSLQETAREMQKAVTEAEAALKQAEKESQEASQRSIHNNEPARRDSQRNMETRAKKMRDEQVRDMSTEGRQWAMQEQKARTRVQQAQQQERTARTARGRAEDKLRKADEKKSQPDQIESLKQQLDKAKQRESAAKQNAQAADETRRFAAEQRKKVDAKKRDLQREKQTQLSRPNPAAQLAEEGSRKAAEALAEVKKQLQEISKELGEQPDLNAATDRAEDLANGQERINNDVESAGDLVASASRHEQRLGQEALAEKLKQASDSIQQDAKSAGQEAADALKESAENATASQQAGEEIAQAMQKFGDEAKRLEEMMGESGEGQSEEPTASASSPREPQGSKGQGNSEEGNTEESDQSSAYQETPNQEKPDQQGGSSSPESQGQRPSEPSQGGSEKARKMAQTLDELDRWIAANEKSPPSDDQGSPQQDGQSQQDSQQQGPDPSSQPQNAAQASPTLSQMMDAQQQQSAKQRQQQLQPGQSKQASQQQSESQSKTKDGDALTNNAGPGDAPDDGGTLGQIPGGLSGEWGELRERKTDDATESGGSRVAPQYRREVEAYFKAIARRAAMKQRAEIQQGTEKSRERSK